MRVAAVFIAAFLAGPAPAAELPPQPAERITPSYPIEANFSGVDGRVIADVTVLADGTPAGIALVEEIPADLGFAPAAIDALKQWRFVPGRPGLYRVRLRFKAPPLPKPVHRQMPSYPPAALDGPLQGAALLQVSVAADGTVDDVTILQENPPGYGFGKSARNAVLNWTFEPGMAAVGSLLVRFRIDGEGIKPDIAVKPDTLPLAPKPTRSFAPPMPESAAKAGVTGWADILVHINKAGVVSNASAYAEDPVGYGFLEAAFKAVLRWQFRDTPEGNYRVRVNFPGTED